MILQDIFFDDYGDLRVSWQVLSVMLVVLGIIGGVVGFVSILVGESCERTANVMELEFQYSFWTQCLIKTSGGNWIKLNNYNSLIKG